MAEGTGLVRSTIFMPYAPAGCCGPGKSRFINGQGTAQACTVLGAVCELQITSRIQKVTRANVVVQVSV